MASVAPVCAKAASRSVSGMAEARPEVRVSTTDCADLRHRQLAPERGGGGREGRNAGRERIGDAERVEPAQLLAQGAPDREIAGMQPRHVLAALVRPHEFGRDRVEVERRRVDERAPGGHQARISGGTMEPA